MGGGLTGAYGGMWEGTRVLLGSLCVIYDKINRALKISF